MPVADLCHVLLYGCFAYYFMFHNPFPMAYKKTQAKENGIACIILIGLKIQQSKQRIISKSNYLCPTTTQQQNESRYF